MNRDTSKNTAIIALLFAAMIVIEVISQLLFQTFPLPIKPTITFIPVIVASILFGPRVGATLGLGMGIMSVVRNSILIGASSYLFSPLAPGGNLNSLIIAIFPRVLIGIIPHVIYNVTTNRFGAALAGASGAITNTVFVLTGAFLLFPNFMNGDGQKLMQAILSTLSLIEIIIATTLTKVIVPRLNQSQFVKLS